MGQLTTAQIISEGLLMAGDSSLTTRAERWLNAWLRSQYAGFAWPFLLRSAEAALASSQNELTFGMGSNGVTEAIRRIVDPVHVYDDARTAYQQLRIRNAIEATQEQLLLGLQESQARGVPTSVRVLADTSLWGRWTLKFDRWADRDLTVSINFYIQPADVSGTDVPLYPNDRTLMKAVEAETLRFKKADNYQNELEVLASMISDDRMKFGEVPGQNEDIGLDPLWFRRPNYS